MILDWNEEKNEILKKSRGVAFEEVEQALLKGKLLEIVNHPNQKKYPNQKIMYLMMNAHIYCVPFVENKEIIFLKTIYPSRKVKKLFMENSNEKD